VNIQKFARKLTEENQLKGSFSVHVYACDDIQELLTDFQDLIRKYYPESFVQEIPTDAEIDEYLACLIKKCESDDLDALMLSGPFVSMNLLDDRSITPVSQADEEQNTDRRVHHSRRGTDEKETLRYLIRHRRSAVVFGPPRSGKTRLLRYCGNVLARRMQQNKNRSMPVLTCAIDVAQAMNRLGDKGQVEQGVIKAVLKAVARRIIDGPTRELDTSSAYQVAADAKPGWFGAEPHVILHQIVEQTGLLVRRPEPKYTSFADEKMLGLFRDGTISAESYLDLCTDYHFRLAGVEDMNAYAKAVAAVERGEWAGDLINSGERLDGMAGNVLRRLNEAKTNAAILITFPTISDGIEKRLRYHGLSYVRVMPAYGDSDWRLPYWED